MLKKFKEVYFKKTGKELAEKLASGYYHNNKIQIDNVFTQIMEYSESARIMTKISTRVLSVRVT